MKPGGLYFPTTSERLPSLADLLWARLAAIGDLGHTWLDCQSHPSILNGSFAQKTVYSRL